MRLLIECSCVYQHPYVHTGIQRVVRNVVACLGSVQEVDAFPVMIRRGAVRRVNELTPARRLPHRLSRWLSFPARVFSLWIRVCAMLSVRGLATGKRPGALRKLWAWGCRLLAVPGTAGLFVCDTLKQHFEPGRSTAMDLQQGDILVLLDAGWQSADRTVVDSCKSRGVQVVQVIYDLIPLSHPHFWGSGFLHAFNAWFDWIACRADGFIAISATVRDDVRQQVLQRLPASQQSFPWFDFFHLGTELDRRVSGAAPDPRLSALFDTRKVYLMVSTIEPRKNHAYLLDAFDILWAGGSDVCLCFIGRRGWKNSALMQRIENHPELGQRLHLFGDAGDADLEYAYDHARALVFSSLAEGFGLPLVEAMRRGLPAMAGDIPVFREIGQEYIAYFDLAQPQALAALVRQFEDTGVFPAMRPLRDWSWIDWQGATDQLVSRVVLHSSPH